MRIAKMLIDDIGGKSCFHVLPGFFNSEKMGTKAEVIQCSGSIDGRGCAIIRISDPKEELKDIPANFCSKQGNDGTYVVERVSKKQLIAIVSNYSCNAARYVAESNCFIASAVLTESGQVCWTVIGFDDDSIRALLKRLRDENYRVLEISTHAFECKTLLTSKQEESLRLALERGYYDVPKKTNVRELSAIMGVSKSTFNVSLRTAEKTIIQSFMAVGKNMSRIKRAVLITSTAV